MNFKESLIKYYSFTEQDWQTTIQYYRPMKLAAKEYFVKKGQVAKWVAVINQGLLRTFQYDDKGNEITMNFHEPGTVVLSADSFNFQKPAHENIVAIDDCDLLVINYKDFLDLYEKIPRWMNICKDVAEHHHKEMSKRVKSFQT